MAYSSASFAASTKIFGRFSVTHLCSLVGMQSTNCSNLTNLRTLSTFSKASSPLTQLLKGRVSRNAKVEYDSFGNFVKYGIAFYEIPECVRKQARGLAS